MPSRCVAAGCSNTTKEGVSVHKFPSDAKYRRIWTANVKLTRAKWSGATKNSMLCSAHFEPSCFERGLHSQFGMKFKAMLLPNAVPTIFPLSKRSEKRPEKRRGAFLKRERLRTLQSALPHEENVTDPMIIDQGDQCSSWGPQDTCSTSVPSPDNLAQAKDIACQTEPVLVTQLTSTSFICVDAAAQTTPDVCDVSIDCKLLNDKEVPVSNEEMEEEMYAPVSHKKSPEYIPPSSSSSDSSDPHIAQSFKRRGRSPRTVKTSSVATQPQDQLK